MIGDYLTDEEFLEKLPQIGEGSEFRYDTVILPMGPDDLPRMLSEARLSFDDLMSRVQEPVTTDRRDRLSGMMALESDILDALRSEIDDGVEEPRNYIIASVLKSIVRVNGELSSILDRASDGNEEDVSAGISECERELGILKGMAENPAPRAKG